MHSSINATIDSGQLDIKSLKRRNFKNLGLPNCNGTSGDEKFVEKQRQDTISNHKSRTHTKADSLVSQLASLELGVEFKLDLREDDLKSLAKLGSGVGGTVTKVVHIPTKTVMAKKMIHIEKKPAVLRQIVRELHIMHECDSSHIVSFFGAFVNQANVIMCMEFMNCGSLDRISKINGPIDEPVLAKITHSVVEGLNYLYNEHRIIHRDVKPGNVLVNSRGQIKLCDFGVSGELTNSIAETFVGTSTYMSPERIQGGAYSVKGDVWSLGLMLLELAMGHFPFASNNTPVNNPMGILDLLQSIVNEEPPSLPEDGDFSVNFRQFITKCLSKETQRPTPEELLTSDPFYISAKDRPFNMAEWAEKFKFEFER